MAYRTVITDKDETLRKVSRPVVDFDKKLWDLLDDMYDTMVQYDGVGLAAPQVGILRRCAVIDVGEGKIELVNPEIIERSGTQDGSEGCLSSPGVYGYVERPMKVTVRAQDRNGNFYEITGEELLARALCHEIDHLDGKLFLDIARDLTKI